MMLSPCPLPCRPAPAGAAGWGSGMPPLAVGFPGGVEHRHLVPAGVDRAELDHVRAFPVALPVEVVLEGHELLEAVAVVAASGRRRRSWRRNAARRAATSFSACSKASARKPVAYQGTTTVSAIRRRLRRGSRPGPRRSCPVPRRRRRRGSRSCRGACFRASAGALRRRRRSGIVRHSTGRIWPLSISSLAFMHS